MIGMICLIFLRFGDLVCGEKFSHRAVPSATFCMPPVYIKM